jgi:hypothetical protein
MGGRLVSRLCTTMLPAGIDGLAGYGTWLGRHGRRFIRCVSELVVLEARVRNNKSEVYITVKASVSTGDEKSTW